MSKIRDFFRTVVGPDEADAEVNTPAAAPPPPDALAPAATADFAGTFEEAKKVVPFLPALAAGARTVGGVLLGAGAAGVLGPAALVTGGAIVVAGVIIAGAGAISSANERADSIDDEGVNEGGVPDSTGFDAGPPTVPRNPEDERTPNTERPETGTPDEGLPPTQPIPRLNPEDERSPETQPSPGTGPPAPVGAVEADPSVIDQGVAAVQGFFQGSDDEGG